MHGARRSGGRRRAAALAVATAAGVAGVLLVTAPAASRSDAVSARLASEAVTGPACSSPVSVCVRGTLQGRLKGTYELTATSLTPTADTPTTSVVLLTGDVRIATRDGTLACKDAGALATTGDRAVTSTCTVVGGTGELAGTTGRLRLSGVAPDVSGETDAPGEAVLEGTLHAP